MKVILLEDVKALGKKGEIVNVSYFIGVTFTDGFRSKKIFIGGHSPTPVFSLLERWRACANTERSQLRRRFSGIYVFAPQVVFVNSAIRE